MQEKALGDMWSQDKTRESVFVQILGAALSQLLTSRPGSMQRPSEFQVWLQTGERGITEKFRVRRSSSPVLCSMHEFGLHSCCADCCVLKV